MLLVPSRMLFYSLFVNEDDYNSFKGDIIARYSTSKAITPDLPIEEPDNSLTSEMCLIVIIIVLMFDPSFVESLINRDTSIVHSSKIDPILKEFAGELAHIAPIPPGIVEADFDPNDDTSSDDDSFENIEYIDASPSYSELVSLEKIEPDQKGLISIDNSNEPLLELPEFESFHFDLSFPRPLPEPPDVEICLHFEPDAPVIDNFNELNEDQRGSEIIFLQNVEDDDSFTFVIQTFLPFLTYPEASPLSCSTGSEDTIFEPDIIPFPSRVGGIFNGSFLF
ncbi:hypothetical protein Tco_0256562 [Tanacetum coccineum]